MPLHIHSEETVKAFFAHSETLDHLVLRPLSHIHSNWELWWDDEKACYESEDDSFSDQLNLLIAEVARARPPRRYHDNEDRLAMYVAKHLKWNIRKEGPRWVGADYAAIIEHGSYYDMDERELVLAVAGRVQAAFEHRQTHIDLMDKSHAKMLGAVMTVICYRRADNFCPGKVGAQK